MHFEELEEALQSSIDDRQVTRGERKALRALIQERAPTPREIALLRSRAYEIARETLDAPRAKEVLDWLEDVVGLLIHHAGGTPDAPAEFEAHFSPGEDCLGAVVEELRRARRTADICVFTITDDRISEGILSAARRGVSVRVITDDDKSGDRGSDAALFEREGIPIATDRSPNHMHHKFAVFDGVRLVTGSFNWTRSASRGNNENLLVTTEPRLTGPYRKEFERLWAEYSPSSPRLGEPTA